MNLARPAVFIFGAGATKGGLSNHSVSPPVDTDFFDIANQLDGHGTPTLAKYVLKNVWELYGRTSGIALEAYYRDIETREKIGLFAKTRNKPKDWQRRRKDLEELIRRVVVHTTCDTAHSPHTPRVSQSHQTLLKQLRKEDAILTFNYDTVIEESFENADIWSPVDGYGPNVYGHRLAWGKKWLSSRGARPDQPSKVELLKLHGSLNWVLDSNSQVRLKPHPYTVRTRDGHPIFDKVSILPPGWNKRIDRNPYKQFWRIARRKLEQCQSLIIIGYSLPETDLLARALFAEVVRARKAQNHALKQLHLADPNAVITQRFIDLFTPTLGATGHVFKYSCIDQLAQRLPSA
jgi:hypothetical protein